MKDPSPVTPSRRFPRGRHLSLVICVLVSILAIAAGCGPPSNADKRFPSKAQVGAAARDETAGDWFLNRAEEAGLDFAYFNGMAGDFYFPEMMGGGVALFDYDNDGDLDVYFAQGRMLGPSQSVDQAIIPPHALPLRGRLYRNDLTVRADGSRQLHFTDLTAQSGIDATDYGMGVAAGDFNNDGCVDLYLTNFGPNHLYRNNCDGTFSDVSQSSGVGDSGWSVSAAFVD